MLKQVFSGVIVIAHAAMLLVVVAQGLLIFVGWGDLVETPGALAALDREPTPDVSKSGGFAHNESDRDWDGEWGPRDGDNQRGYLSGPAAAGGTSSWLTRSAPAWGGGGAGAEEESKRQTPSHKKGFGFGNPDRNSGKGKSKGGGDAGKKKEKKWETWEKPLQKAKNSFFPSPANSGHQVAPAPGAAEPADGGKWKFADDDLESSWKRDGGGKGKGVPVVKASSSWAVGATGGEGGGGGGEEAAASSVYPTKPSRKSLRAAAREEEAAAAAAASEDIPRSRSMSPKRWYRDQYLAAQEPSTADQDAAIKAAALDGVSGGAGAREGRGFRSSGGVEKRRSYGKKKAVKRSSSSAAAADAGTASYVSRTATSARVGRKPAPAAAAAAEAEVVAMGSNRPLGSGGGGGGGGNMASNPRTSSSTSMATTEYSSGGRRFPTASSNASGNRTPHRPGRTISTSRSRAYPNPSPDAAITTATVTPAAAAVSAESTSSKGSTAQRFWKAGGRSSTGGVDIFPTGTPVAAAPRRRSRSPRAREECPPTPTDRDVRGRNLEPPAPDGPPTLWEAERSTGAAIGRRSRRVSKADEVGGGARHSKRASRHGDDLSGRGKAGSSNKQAGRAAGELSGGRAAGSGSGSAGSMWATAPHAPSSAAANFASEGAAGDGAPSSVAVSTSMQRSFDIYASNPASRRRKNMQVVLSPASSTLSGLSSSMLGVPAPAPSAPAPSAPQDQSSPAAAAGPGVGAAAGIGRGRGREAARHTIKPQFSTEGLFGSKPSHGAGEQAPPQGTAGAQAPAPAAGTGIGDQQRGRSTTAGRDGTSRNRDRSPWVPGAVGTGQRSRTLSPANGTDEERSKSLIGEDAAKLFPENDEADTFASYLPMNMKQRKEKNIQASAKKREDMAAAAAAGQGRSGGGGGDDPHAPPFTRDFRSLSGSSIGGDSGWSFGGLGGGGGGYGGNAKRSFFPDSLAPLCSSPAGVAAAATARGAGDGASSRGSGVSGFSGIVSHNNDGTGMGGGGRGARGHRRNVSNTDSNLSRGGLLQRSRKDILDFYRNGAPRERVESFEAEVVYNRPFLKSLAEQADGGGEGGEPQTGTVAAADTKGKKTKSAEARAAAAEAARQRRWGGGRRLLTTPDF